MHMRLWWVVRITLLQTQYLFYVVANISPTAYLGNTITILKINNNNTDTNDNNSNTNNNKNETKHHIQYLVIFKQQWAEERHD